MDEKSCLKYKYYIVDRFGKIMFQSNEKNCGYDRSILKSMASNGYELKENKKYKEVEIKPIKESVKSIPGKTSLW